ncbi:HAD family hydrolase [Baekduia soli]|uniref:HAD family hydrolase n=1 Tax=Baekduia soli TaxID=496014 RepID=A0A5B8U3R4_9ACTN|nr:HAD family hydrolase [Baekduia soli]QEC47699.1 HAD family hydrolase [Baekduia soli]
MADSGNGPARPASPPGGVSAAFFDLDRTLMSGSSGFFWARAAARAGMISRRRLALDAWENIRFRLRGSTDATTDRVMVRVGAMLEGKRVVDFDRLGPQVLAGVLPRLYPQMLQIAWDHQDAGRPAYIVSAASQETAAMIAHVLGFDGALGTPLERRDGRYTGRLAGPFAYRDGKPQLMQELAAREGIDLAESYAYSDSESDLPMLRAVGHPVAVNPDGALARVAREEGWDILRFDRLGGHLKMLGGLTAAGLLGAVGRTAVRRAGPR